MRNDYQQWLDLDWADFRREVQTLLKEKPGITIEEIIDITGGDYEDILWIINTNR